MFLFEPIFKICLITVLGYVAGYRNAFSEESASILCRYVFLISMPCFLFGKLSMGVSVFSIGNGFLFSFALSLLFVGAVGFSISRFVFKQNMITGLLAGMASCYTNSAFIGIPLFLAVFDDIRPIVLVNFFQIIVVTTSLLIAMEFVQLQNSGIGELKKLSKLILSNPLIGSISAGITCAYLEVEIPQFISDSVKLIGEAGIPTALFAFGLSLAARPLRLTKDSIVLVIVVLKAFVHPFVAWLLGRYVFHLNLNELAMLVSAAGIPTAMNNFVFAERFNKFVIESAQIVLLSSICSIVTYSFIFLFLLQ